MTYRILLAIALVGLSSSLSTGGFLSSTTPSATRSTSPADTAGPPVDSAPGSVSLRSRRELPKRASDVKVHRDPETGETDATGRIVIKFRDHLRVRAPLTPMDRAMSDVDPSVGDRVAMMLARHGGTISQWINRSPERLAALERRAAENSGRAQPDLAGMLVVSFHEAKTDEALEAAATEFQGLASVEFVVVEHAPRAPFADYHSGAEVASAQAGIEDPASDSTAAAPVSVASDEFVPDEACRKRVAEIVPECDGRTGAEWDARCLAYAHSLCEGSVFTDPGQPRPNPCFSDASGLGTDPRFAPFLDEVSGPCDRAHDGRGCNRAPCCREVCAIDPNCCEVSWDEGCVALAHSTVGCTGDEGHGPMAMVLPPLPCGVAPPAGAGGVALGAAPAANAAYTANTVRTPDLSGVQVYRKQATATLPASWIGTTNFLGQGFNLDGANSLASLQDDLFNAYGLGPINRAGATVRVGVMDYSAYLNHEDFIAKTVPSCTSPLAWELLDAPKVIGEPDQTVLLTQGADNDPNHGTSVLGIIVAANQDVTGTPANENFGAIGLAHNAQGYLFPLVSIEEGYRPQNAITSCFETFATGDVLVVPWAPAGDQGTTLVSNPDFNTLIRLGSDLGVTTVCQAGDQSVEVLAQPADSGAIVVGSVTSGRTKPGGNCGPALCAGEWKRGINSNFSDPDTDNDPDTGHPLASVDVAAWMGGVFTTGLAPVPPNPLLDAVLVPSAAAPKNFPNTTLGTPPGALNLKLDNPLEVNKLRNYNQAFGGTSAATAMIGASVALLQATTKQAFGGGTLVPEQMRQVLADWGDRQCNVECMVTDPPQPRPQDCCACGATSCGTEQNLVGSVVPNLYDCGIAIFTNDFSEGNPTEIELRTGFPINGTFSPIFIRAVDRNYLRIGTVQASAGSLVDGLRYLATGPTTDLYAKLRSSITDPNQIENLGLIVRGRATAPVTIVGGFMYNYAASRWDFIGAGVYLPAVPQADVAMPILNPNLSNYFTPSGVFKARIWTCSLGPAGPNQVWHDFISIGVNDPAFVPAP